MTGRPGEAGVQPVAFELLGTAITVAAADAAIAARLQRCYAAVAAAGRPAGAARQIDGAVRRAGGGFTIAVAGRAPQRAADPTAAVRALNHELLHALMIANPHLFYVHAGVVAVAGRAVVLPGLSRAGKSTLVLAMLQAGARLLSDELLVVDPATRSLLPFARAVKVRDECLGYFPDLAAHFSGEGEGRFVDLAAFGPEPVAAAARPRVLAAPTWNAGGDDRLRPISAGAGLLHLATSALNFGSHRQAAVDHLAALAGACRCFELVWSDPRRAAAALLEALAEADR